MSEKKECPLRVLAGKTAEFALCRGEDCAWWTNSDCAIRDIPFWLMYINSTVKQEVKDVK